MKILIHGINYSPELTGIGKYSGEMAEWFASRGHEVRVVTAPPYYPAWKLGNGYSAYKYKKESITLLLPQSKYNNDNQHGINESPQLTVYRCPLWIPARPNGAKRIFHLVSFALSSLPLMLANTIWRPDAVMVIEPPLFCSPAAILLARLSRGKVLMHVQDFEVDAAFDMGLLRSQWLRRAVLYIERWLMLRFDKVSTISKRMLQRLQSKGVNDQKTLLFPNWVNTDTIKPMKVPSSFRTELEIVDDDLVLLYSGNMGQKQGLELIVEAAQLLVEHGRIRFVMCGQGTAYESLRRMAEGLQNIIWIPLQPLDRLNDLLNLADIHLLPQRADAADLVMPSKLTGILASGRPVIATAAEGTEVWTVVNERGITTPPGDVRAFSAAIMSLVDNAEERLRLGQNGRRYAEKNLSTDAVLKRFEKELLLLTGNTK